MRLLDRRRTRRDGVDGEPPRLQLVTVIVGTYRELPNLALTLHVAARLFGLRVTTCQIVLTALVARGELRRTETGHYVRGLL